MKMIKNFGYKGQSVTICKKEEEGAYYYSIMINGRELEFKKRNEDRATRLAKKYVDSNYDNSVGIMHQDINSMPFYHKIWATPLQLSIKGMTKLVNLFNKAIEKIIYR